jgi:UDP-N-acetylmuramoyl-L-alanyl-D-glutamate--2,6-diaminopimelate ligase
LSSGGTELIVNTPKGKIEIHSKLIGKFNIYNILASIGAGIAEGIDLKKITAGIESVKLVPGRLERVVANSKFDVYVDYAHTDDALKNVLTAIRELTHGRVITLFGCGGDRDTSKRPRMGKVVSELSDYVVITTDNPRSEDPQAIANQVLTGIEKNKSSKVFVVLDRQEAIKKAISLAKEGDIVLLAGKGHETYQIFKNIFEPFDDREVARKILANIGHTQACSR